MNNVLAEIQEFEVVIDSVVDSEILKEIRQRLSDLLDRLDDKLDLRLIEERRSEPTISRTQFTNELRIGRLI